MGNLLIGAGILLAGILVGAVLVMAARTDNHGNS